MDVIYLQRAKEINDNIWIEGIKKDSLYMVIHKFEEGMW